MKQTHCICFLPLLQGAYLYLGSIGFRFPKTEIEQKGSEMQFIRDLYARELKVGLHDPHRKINFDKYSQGIGWKGYSLREGVYQQQTEPYRGWSSD